MPTFVAGFRGVFKIQDSGNTTRDISNVTTKVDFPRTVDKLETTALTNSSKAYIPGLSDGMFNWSGEWDQTVLGYWDGILTAQAAGTFQSRTFEYGPAGSTTGLPKYTGAFVLVQFGETTDVSAELQMTAALQLTGAVTPTVY